MEKTINVERMYKRFSEISGIPLKDLRPIEVKDLFKTGVANYIHDYHLINYNENNKYNKSSISDHELTHALQSFKPDLEKKLISRRWIVMEREYNKIKKDAETVNREFYEPTAYWPENIFKALKNHVLYKNHFFKSFLRMHFTRKLIQRHGEDGLLLLYVAPPKKLDALEIPKWRKEMVSKGYLKDKGGLTKKGLSYWRQNLQPESIWQFLANAKKLWNIQKEKKSAHRFF